MAHTVLSAIQAYKKLEDVYYDDEKNKDYSDEEYVRLSDEVDAANRTEMVLPVRSKTDAVAKMLLAANLVSRPDQIDDDIAKTLAQRCKRIGSKIEHSGRKANALLKCELHELIDTIERLDEENDAIPRLQAVLVWLQGREWWMILRDDKGEIASPNAPKFPKDDGSVKSRKSISEWCQKERVEMTTWLGRANPKYTITAAAH
jgi:hypothetical protein